MLRNLLKQLLSPAENHIWGMADLTGLLVRKFEKYRLGISIGRKLDDRILDALKEGPTLEYFMHYRQVNKELSETAGRIKEHLHQKGIDALVIEPTISTDSEEFEEYMSTLSVDISHKMVATRAGLGWIGKTDLFISREFGPRLRLVSVLLDQEPGGAAQAVDRSLCGTCTLCVEQCPAGAANGLLWNITVHRDAFFNAHKCRDMCARLAAQRLGVNERICGLCVSVCPIGKRTNHGS